MTNKERVNAILHYENFNSVPVVHFGFWHETYQKFEREGHIKAFNDSEKQHYSEENTAALLGFDMGWNTQVGIHADLMPAFPEEIIKEFPDGSYHIRNGYGVVIHQRPGATSIPAEVSHTLIDRESFQNEFLPRLQLLPERLHTISTENIKELNTLENPLGVYCGSLYGRFRDYAGLVGTAYLYADDEGLFKEIIDTIANLCYETTKHLLAQGLMPDFGHFWEDICYKNGPLVSPAVFEKYVGPHYRKIADLFTSVGCDIISVDCDGNVDALLPIWLSNGVNTMFPIEVGTWGSEIGSWRKKYGRDLRGVGGMDKRVFAKDYAAIDDEIERLRPLVELGGYIPCPDHRIAPDAKWENVQYYCERFRKVFGG